LKSQIDFQRRFENYVRLPKRSILKEGKKKQFIGRRKEGKVKDYLNLFHMKLLYPKSI
jgi:hypothetical protein